MRRIIEIGLLIVAGALVYFIVSGIQRPIEFDKVKAKRYEKVVENLKDIREIQIAYKAKNEKYCGNLDTLVQFALNDSLLQIVKIGDIEDSLAVARGEVRWDSSYVAVLDKLIEENKLSKSFNIDSLKYIPFTKGDVFEMGAGKVMTASKVEVQVFEASAPNKKILQGLDSQLIINLNEDQEKRTGFPGLKVGSLSEANNNAGNWE